MRVLGGLLLLPALPFFVAPHDLAASPPGALAAVLYLALISSIVAYGAWYWALAKGDIGATGSIQFAQPLIGLLLATTALASITFCARLATAMPERSPHAPPSDAEASEK